MNNLHSCAGCLWEGECNGMQRCEDYTPYDDDAVERAGTMMYELDLMMREDAYQEVIGEYSDDD